MNSIATAISNGRTDTSFVAKQYARGELYQGSRVDKHRWQGKWLAKDPDYWDQPWEIEAHGKEIGLFVRWAEKEGLGNKKWTHDD